MGTGIQWCTVTNSPGICKWNIHYRDRAEPLAGVARECWTSTKINTYTYPTDVLHCECTGPRKNTSKRLLSHAKAGTFGAVSHWRFNHSNRSRTQNLQAYCERILVTVPECHMLLSLEECVATQNRSCIVMRLLTYIRNTPFFQLSEQQAASVLPGSLLIISLVFLLVLAFFSLLLDLLILKGVCLARLTWPRIHCNWPSWIHLQLHSYFCLVQLYFTSNEAVLNAAMLIPSRSSILV